MNSILFVTKTPPTVVKICQAYFIINLSYLCTIYCFGPLSKTHIPVAIYAGVLGQ